MALNYNKSRINRILEAIFPLPEKFGIEIFEYNSGIEPVDFSLLQDNIFEVDPEALIEYGMSKLVILSPNIGNVVIKIPFNGCFEQEETYDDDDDDDENMIWYPFSRANASDRSDYCLAEYEKFLNLKAVGLSCFVTETEFYEERNGVRIFLQERVISEEDSCGTPQASCNSKKLAENWKKERRFFALEPEWVANCLDDYGTERTESFLNYCDKVDSDILRDAHPGNVGYRINGNPVILDFSNYDG